MKNDNHRESESKAEEIRMFIGVFIAFPVMYGTQVLSEKMKIPFSLLASACLFTFFPIYTFVQRKKLEKERKIIFALITFAFLCVSTGLYIDWKVVEWLDETKLPLYLPFMPVFLYVVWITCFSKNSKN